MPTCEELGFSPEECAALSPEDKAIFGIEGDAEKPKRKPKKPRALNKFQNRYLYHANSGARGILKAGFGPQGQYYVLRDPETNKALAYVQPGDTLLDEANRDLISVADFRNLRVGKASEDDLRLLLGEEGGGSRFGGGTAARDYLGEQQAAQAFQASEAEKDRAFQAQQAELARQESKRQDLLNNARQLVEARMGERSRAREQGTQLAGNDPFRLTGALQGVALGSDIQTPYDIFKTQVGSVATQEIPQISPNASIADLESAIGKLAPQQTTGVPFVGGFAQGGQDSMMGPYEARLVGEQGPEVMITGGGMTQIVPLQRGMATGGSVDLQNVSLGTFPDAFRNLRRSLGVSEDFGPLSAGSRSRLGYAAEGAVPQASAQFGQGAGQLGSPLTLERGLRDLQKAGQIDDAGVNRLTQLIGFLPSPRAAAAQFQNMNPAEKEALLSAYKLAGIDPDTFNFLVQSAVVSGPERRGISIAA